MKSRFSGPHAGALVLAGGLLFSGSPLDAAPTRVVSRGTPVRALAPSAAAVSYSVEVPVVTRVVGTALFRTALDISNNTSAGTSVAPVVVRFQYSYNRINTDGTTSFFRTPIQTINLLAFDNFHTDDFVQYLGTLAGVLQTGADLASFGTLLVTFENLPSSQGWEGTVFARTYSPNPAPGVGTVAIAYPGSLFFESANSTLVATIRDTQLAPTAAGALRTNVGVRNTDIRGTGQNATVLLEFYDVTSGSPTNGQRVGTVVTVAGLQPGEVRQINNVRAVAAIPNNVTAMLVFADVAGATATTPTIEGYVNILDGGTQDGAFFEMKCADTDGCGN